MRRAPESWARQQRLLLHHGFGNNDKLVVLAGNIEMLHVIAQMIAVTETRQRGLTESENVRQCWLESDRGCMRVSMMLSLIGSE